MKPCVPAAGIFDKFELPLENSLEFFTALWQLNSLHWGGWRGDPLSLCSSVVKIEPQRIAEARRETATHSTAARGRFTPMMRGTRW